MSTGINYLDETWSPITGCSGKNCKVRDHCWAREMVKRFPAIHEHEQLEYPGIGIPFNQVQFHPDRLDKPLHWRKPRRVGVCFMGDMFDEQVPLDWQNSVYVRMVKYDWHTYFILTKQPQRLNEWIKIGTGWRGMIPHVWHGVSITDQEDADRMIPELLRIPGKRWISVEPMMGPIKLLKTWDTYNANYYLNWVVLGCESGPKRRHCPHEWMIDVVRQCKAAGVKKCYVKQVDINGKVSHKPEEWPEELRVRELP